jgi:hypothetical protein
MACAICNIRREKRHCPGLPGEICAICCGEQREETISCPLDCEYLQIAHLNESREAKDPAGIPNRDFRLSRDFLEKNVELVMALQHALLLGAIENNAIDNDVKEALDGLVRTYRTLGSGLVYESRPSNPIAGAVFEAIQKRVSEIRDSENERGVHKLQDTQVLSILVFLQQMEYAFNNGRKRGRSFLHNLGATMASVAAQQRNDASSLIVS